ncbi:hypothetical protein AVEN_222886-1 [Araneus ventricosus]|uniref:Uncharacterized protein n=1 Tax=Araneus ventricosus TaxID=182803 RepID=A0A4Y2RPK1_ARAVE|nr:hypothetical protein AVEN_222886-1 [Araneus ventricosus]
MRKSPVWGMGRGGCYAEIPRVGYGEEGLAGGFEAAGSALWSINELPAKIYRLESVDNKPIFGPNAMDWTAGEFPALEGAGPEWKQF